MPDDFTADLISAAQLAAAEAIQLLAEYPGDADLMGVAIVSLGYCAIADPQLGETYLRDAEGLRFRSGSELVALAEDYRALAASDREASDRECAALGL